MGGGFGVRDSISSHPSLPRLHWRYGYIIPLLSCASTNHFAKNYLCQYVPAFSVLWHPFFVHESLNKTQIIYISYSILVALYLAAPVLKVTVQQIVQVLHSIIKGEPTSQEVEVDLQQKMSVPNDQVLKN